ncbi:MAG: LPS-assembly protein LptD [Acetobacteraceae bacterium]|nr:LPS-assembly protein LptD [Acetobacteraceae bacterium]
MTQRLNWLAIAGLAGLVCVQAGPAEAQFAAQRRRPGTPPRAPISRNEPVAFTADQVEYDRDRAIVTASGNVEAWQNDHILRADKVTFDRNTNIAAASGHVVLVEPDGQVLFSDYAELTEGMREGVLKGMRALLAENGKLVANGARRSEGNINELSRAVYTTCDLCKKDPSRAPLWQLRARDAVQDQENKKIEYRDAVLDIYGIPVAYFPYFWHADPSVRRASGFLVPSFGHSKQLGEFLTVPYYWVLDDNSDATFIPTFNTQQYLNIDTEYRRRFNDGTLTVDTGLGYSEGKLQGAIFAKGQFAYDDTWRYGFDVNRASSATYLRDYRFQNRGDILTSRVYVEGFGTGAYARADALAYQGLVSSINQSRLPYVLPRYQYSYMGGVDDWGGRLSLDTENFNIIRAEGTNTQRFGARLEYERPFLGTFGETYKLNFRTDAAAYSATSLDQNPNYFQSGTAQLLRAQPNVALEVRWPLVREGGGRQIIEPIAQMVAGPQTGGIKSNVPNEDSLGFEFTDQNLFSINKFPGIDRQEGGLRFNYGLHMNWTTGGRSIDTLVGQSYRTSNQETFPIGSGLDHKVSDVVTRTTFTPASWLDVIGRTRLDRRDLSLRFADVTGSTGPDKLKLSLGYIYSDVSPYFLYDTPTVPASYFQPRNEVTLGLSTNYDHYRLSTYARRNVADGKMVAAGMRATYEDECIILDANLSRRYTSLNGDNGATLVLFQITFKTVGQFGFHAF